MKWPWQKVMPERATLTLLPPTPGGPEVVLGVPSTLTYDETHTITLRMRDWIEWTADHRLIVFPFPIEVIDKR